MGHVFGLMTAYFWWLSLCLLATACSGGGKFQGGGAAASGAPVEKAASTAPNTSVATEEFAVEKVTLQAKIDMLWLIDNSGSMQEEAAQVRKNFSQFITSVTAKTDLRLGLISMPEPPGGGPSTGVSLPPEFASSSSLKQFPLKVESTNALAIAAVASCPQEGSDLVPVVAAAAAFRQDPLKKVVPTTFKACGSPVTIPSTERYKGGIEFPMDVQNARGAASSLLRPDAKRVYVIVTDDGLDGIDDKNFVEVINGSANKPKEAPVIFSFRGFPLTGTATCKIANVGAQYEALAQATGGGTFDICAPDWTPQFDKLVTQVVELAKPTIDLTEKKIVKIIEVRVDDAVIAPDSYTLDQGIIRFKDGAVKNTSKVFRIVFERET